MALFCVNPVQFPLMFNCLRWIFLQNLRKDEQTRGLYKKRGFQLLTFFTYECKPANFCHPRSKKYFSNTLFFFKKNKLHRQGIGKKMCCVVNTTPNIHKFSDEDEIYETWLIIGSVTPPSTQRKGEQKRGEKKKCWNKKNESGRAQAQCSLAGDENCKLPKYLVVKILIDW